MKIVRGVVWGEWVMWGILTYPPPIGVPLSKGDGWRGGLEGWNRFDRGDRWDRKKVKIER